MIEPKNALIKQYQKLFGMEGVELEIALGPCRHRQESPLNANRRPGLRSILEQVLLDTMYELPGMENVTKVVIDENMITATPSRSHVRRPAEGFRLQLSRAPGSAGPLEIRISAPLRAYVPI